MPDAQLNYYGDPMEMITWRLMDRLHKLMNQQVTVYVAGMAGTSIMEVTGTLIAVGSDYLELNVTQDSQTRPVIIPTTSVILLSFGGPLALKTTSGMPPVGTAITSSA
ncbi:MAG TPA: hypothetical protein GXX25_08455 [Desulfotomaculum sp.]|nr:hypothetical protein [Desulfotomaculum sp.]